MGNMSTTYSHMHPTQIHATNSTHNVLIRACTSIDSRHHIHVCAHPYRTPTDNMQNVLTCAHPQRRAQQREFTMCTRVCMHTETHPTACTTYMYVHTCTFSCTHVRMNIPVGTHKHAQTKQTCMCSHVQTHAHTRAHREHAQRALTTCPGQAQTQGSAGSQSPGRGIQSFRRPAVFACLTSEPAPGGSVQPHTFSLL